MKRIRDTSSVLPTVRDTSVTLPRVDPEIVAKSLGADMKSRVEIALGPITLRGGRAELISRLQSSQGRPTFSSDDRRERIPLNESEWKQLETLAQKIATPGFKPSPVQVASALLNLSLQAMNSEQVS